MPLSESAFQKIIDSLRPTFRQEDLRQTTRVPVQATATILRVGDGGWGKQPVVVRDISLGGVGLLSPRAMAPGDQFVLLLLREGENPAGIACAVRHCRQVDESLFSIGGQFTSLLIEGAAGSPAGQQGEVDRIRRTLLG